MNPGNRVGDLHVGDAVDVTDHLWVAGASSTVPGHIVAVSEAAAVMRYDASRPSQPIEVQLTDDGQLPAGIAARDITITHHAQEDDHMARRYDLPGWPDENDHHAVNQAVAADGATRAMGGEPWLTQGATLDESHVTLADGETWQQDPSVVDYEIVFTSGPPDSADDSDDH